MLVDVLWNCASGIDRPTKNGDKASPVLSCPSVIFLLVRWRRLLLAFGTGEQLEELHLLPRWRAVDGFQR
jgi:hypothetical protein